MAGIASADLFSRSLSVFQQDIKTREWVVGRSLLLHAARRWSLRPISH